ncbi:MAG: hypothetical protein UX94_C0005G0018 [Parcubacteria group bacterium GW2011_GWA2_47_21]|nr:MAG: hypothetical protein UX94_C0005G0018 [Parcubacteria group bacterium GW2011_GWA2_47_21]
MGPDKNKDDTAYLRLMLDAFAKIRAFTEGMSYEDFSVDSKSQSAVIMQLEVVGELAKKVPDSIKISIDIPWKQMAGLRDVVAHDYFSIDLPTIWYTLKNNVPAAALRIKEYLE